MFSVTAFSSVVEEGYLNQKDRIRGHFDTFYKNYSASIATTIFIPKRRIGDSMKKVIYCRCFSLWMRNN